MLPARLDNISLPVALGLLAVTYTVPAKVSYHRLDTVTRDRTMVSAD